MQFLLFNLRNNNNLFIQFRIIPRNIRDIDNRYSRYLPGLDGILMKTKSEGPGGAIDSTLKMWQCYDSKTGRLKNLPQNFKWMNLMKYIAFYKNYLIESPIPDINSNLQIIKTRDEMGLIPYDYE